MDKVRRDKMLVKVSFMVVILFEIFWGIWYLATGKVPVVNPIRWSKNTVIQLPFAISRLWDIVFAVIPAVFLIFLFTNKRIKKLGENSTRALVGYMLFSLLVGLSVGLGIGLGVVLSIGLALGLFLGLVASIAVGVGLVFDLGAGLLVWLSVGLGVGLGVGLVYGMVIGLGVDLIFALAVGLIFVLKFLFSARL